MMEIEAKEFVTFVKKIRMESEQSLSECLFDFKEDGLTVCANNTVNQARIKGVLKPSTFYSYEAIGPVAVNKLDRFIIALKRFKDSIEISKQGNLLIISAKKKSVDIELANEKFITNTTTLPELEFDDVFTLQPDTLKEIHEDVKVDKNVKIKVKTVPQGVIFSNNGGYRFKTTIDSDTCKGGVEVGFAKTLFDCTHHLTDEYKMHVKTDFVTKIVEETDDSIVTIIIAPLVEPN